MILLVEDHSLLRTVLTRSLLVLGYEVVATANADDALRLLEDGLVPSLVLTDVRMPGILNGMDLARWIQTNRPTTPVLLQTGFATENTADFPVLRKPYSDDALAAALESVLGATQGLQSEL